MKTALLAMVSLLGACGAGGAGVADAGAQVPDAASPSVPASPALTPCPAGWREVPPADSDDVATCDPWPASGHDPACALDEAHFPGEPGCTRVGPPCPAGEWSDALPVGPAIRYVRAGGAPGGDGSPASPFGTIAEAMVGAAPGTVIALGKGTFDEAVVLTAGVTLWGACVAETVVTQGTFDPLFGTVTVDGADSAVRSLRVTGARTGVFVPAGDGPVLIEDVIFDGVAGWGVLVQGGHATLRSVVARDGVPAVGYPNSGSGLWFELAATGDAQRVVVDHCRSLGIAVISSGTQLTGANIAVLDTQPNANGTLGRGLDVEQGASAHMERLVLERNHEAGFFASRNVTTVELVDLVVRDTRSVEFVAGEPDLGRGLSIQDGPHVEVTRALIERNREAGVFAVTQAPETYDPVTLLLADVVVRDTLAQEWSGQHGRGLSVQVAQVSVARALLRGNRDLGVMASDTSEVSLLDVTILDTLVQDCTATDTCAWDVTSSLGAYDDAHVDALRFRFARSARVGVQLATGGTADLHDGVLEDNSIAANVQTADYDVQRLQDGVLFLRNAINLDATALPIPQP